MGLPFTSDQFFGGFAEYNRSFWFVGLAWWFASAAALAGAWRNPRKWSGVLMYLLATLWIWNAVAYHALLFTSINPAAWLFAGLFTIEGVPADHRASRQDRFDLHQFLHGADLLGEPRGAAHRPQSA